MMCHAWCGGVARPRPGCRRSRALHAAGRYLDQALADASDHALPARPLEITLAYVEAETGDPAGALARCAHVLARRSRRPHRGKAWQQLGLIRMRTGATEPRWRRSRGRSVALPETSSDLGYAFINRGNVHLQHGRPREAAADFAAAQSASTIPGTGCSGPRPSTTSATRDCWQATWSGRCR